MDEFVALIAEVERLDALMLSGKRLLASLIARHACAMVLDFGSWRPDALHLYPFRHWDAVRGKWVRARYLAEFHEISERHRRFEIVGAHEMRVVQSGYFRTPGERA